MNMEKNEPLSAGNEPENKELISDPQETRARIRNFWKNRTDKDLSEDEIQRQKEELMKHLSKINPQLASLMEAEGEEEEKKIQPARANEIVVASKAREKNVTFSKIAEDNGLQAVSLFEEEKLNEEEDQKIFKELIEEEETYPEAREYSPYFYAVDMAEAKIRQVNENHKDQAIIASDIIVVNGDKIIEKPKSKEEALDILMNISGKEVKVYTGVVILTPTKFDRRVLLKEGIGFSISLRSYSQAEAEQYLEGSDFLNKAGAIDYSDPECDLIDSEKPVVVEPLELEKKNRQKLFLSPRMLSSLSDYFHGVPKELIEEMLQRQKKLNRQD